MKLKILNHKIELALVRAERTDVFDAVEKINKKRQKKRNKLAEKLGFSIKQDESEFRKEDYDPINPYPENE